MKVEVVAAVVVAIAAVAVIAFAFTERGDAPQDAAGPGVSRTATTTPASAATPGATAATAIERTTWLDGLASAPTDAEPVLLSCLDADGDARLTGSDPGVPPGVDITLDPLAVCTGRGRRAEWYRGEAEDRGRYACDGGPASARIIAVGGGGTDLLDARLGESTGFLPVVNGVQERASAAGIETAVTLTAAAVFHAAANAQQALEEWLIADVRAELESLPCLRVVILGHSHGGATVTQVTSALDGAYGDRMLGVLVDRTIALYDRPVDAWPSRTRILNYFQTNEGWHGVPVDLPNVMNIDESAETAPVPSLGGDGPVGIVDHTTLDDAPATQQRIVDAVMGWLSE